MTEVVGECFSMKLVLSTVLVTKYVIVLFRWAAQLNRTDKNSIIVSQLCQRHHPSLKSRVT